MHAAAAARAEEEGGGIVRRSGCSRVAKKAVNPSANRVEEEVFDTAPKRSRSSSGWQLMTLNPFSSPQMKQSRWRIAPRDRRRRRETSAHGMSVPKSEG